MKESVVEQEPIAICGLALKFPQDASSEEGFWAMLLDKRSAMTEFPPERLNINSFYHPTKHNALRTRGAHFIREDLGTFDAGFFSLTPTEAAAMDPMQRILLETTYKAFENSGIRIEDIKGSRTSVHTGCFTNDYLQQILKDSDRLPPYAAVGATQSMLANRISWFYDLRGPSVNLDSACSSSAMAVDLSCQLLHNGTTNIGVVAGCNMLLDPDYSMILSNMQMLSPDGRCFAFDNRANGYSRGEGVGVLILKRLSDALRGNDTIRAIIRSCGTNQDGRTTGITQPDLQAQAQLIRETYMRAGLGMSHTRFFEAHGTGTAIGDPIEIGAIAECFRSHRTSADPLFVGSVKTNIGHLEGASGIAGLIKATLAVESGLIPPNTNFESINRKIASYGNIICLPLECIPWPSCEIRRASVNSFGYGGTNSHIIIDDVASYLRRKGMESSIKTTMPQVFDKGSCHLSITTAVFPKLLVWSASTRSATQAMVSTWANFCGKIGDSTVTQAISDIAYTLDSRRSTLPSKAFAVVSEAPDLKNLEQLTSFSKDVSRYIPRLAFVFTGQGAQWYAMGRELFMYPEFAESIRISQLSLTGLGCSWSLSHELLKDEKESLIHRADVAQCLTAVVQMALVDLLTAFGISPVAVVGHSMGEIAAAYCAEFLTRESALRVAYYRGVLTATIPEKTPTRGAMLVTALSSEQAAMYFNRGNSKSIKWPNTLVVSCINSPCNTTISGAESEIDDLNQILMGEGIFARRLRVPVAYHSPQMEVIVSDCLRGFGILESPPPTADIKMVSSVTGSILTRERACEGSYWTKNLTSPVLFSRAVGRLCQDSNKSLRKKLDGSHREAIVVDTLIEIGPHAALQLPIEQILKDIPRTDDIKYLSALYRNQSASVSLLQLVGQLHCSGVRIDLRHVNDPDKHLRYSRTTMSKAPEYPFDHSVRYWWESPLVTNYRLRLHGHEELLGSPSREWNPLEPQWRYCLQISEMPWLLDHKLSGKVVYPASAMITMAMKGVSQLSGRQNVVGFSFHDVQFESAITIPTDPTNLETRLQLRPLKRTSNINSQNLTWTFSIYSVTGNRWARNCHGTVEVHNFSNSLTEEIEQRSQYYQRSLKVRSESCNQTLSSSTIYSNFVQNGFGYGKSFQGIETLQHDDTRTVIARLAHSRLSSNSQDSFYIMHPGPLDSFFHLALITLSKGSKPIPTQAISRVKRLWISVDGLQHSNGLLQASAKLEHDSTLTKLYSGFALTDDAKKIGLVLDGLQTTVISSIEEVETASKHYQFWGGIQEHVDLDAMSATKAVKRLESICGTDPGGLGDFLRDLRRYLLFIVRELRDSLTESGINPTKPYLKRYVDWMDWHLQRPTRDSCVSNATSLRVRLENQGFLGQFFLRVADNAKGILRGDLDMVQLIFADNSLETFYEQMLNHSAYHIKIQTYLHDLTFKYPNMDFLEVGAGTGSFTQHILAALSSISNSIEGRFRSYYYTDVSPAFFERAQSRFSKHAPKIKFTTFNAEQDPLQQGFDERSFDVIAASNVLHVMKDLDRTLSGLRRLLKPGGRILLHEYVRPETIEVGFVFGLLPGWWPTTGNDGKLSPLLIEEEWDTTLRRNGFSGAEIIIRDFADDDSHLMSIICATAAEIKENESSPIDVCVIVNSNSSEQLEVAEKLISGSNAEGYRMFRMDLPSYCTTIPRVGAVVMLLDLKDYILPRLTGDKFESLKQLLLSVPRILWVSKLDGMFSDPSIGMIDGFARTFRTENISSKLATLVLEHGSTSKRDECQFIMYSLKRLLRLKGMDQPEDYTVRQGLLMLRRVYENTELREAMSDILSGQRQITQSVQNARPFRIELQNLKPLSTARIIRDSSAHRSLGSDELEIEIQAVGLNEVDFQAMSGKHSKLNVGRACAGIITKVGTQCKFVIGDRVCAYGNAMLRSTGRAHQNHVAKIPESMSFEEASILPQDYLIANYLVREARVQQDDIVLVRGGDTRLGRVTLGILKRHTPKLCVITALDRIDKNILGGRLNDGCSRGSVQPCLFTKATVVLDFLDTNIPALAECTEKFGQIFSVRTCIEGDTIPINHSELPTTITFRIVDVLELLKHRLEKLEMVHPDFEDSARPYFGAVKTIGLSSINIVTVSFGVGVEERLAIKYDENSQIQIYEQSKQEKALFDQGASYVISGGLGDLGRCIATWMVSRGARNLILLSRSGPQTEIARATVRHLEEKGAIIHTPLCDITDRSSLQSTLQQLEGASPIKGCIQAAGALKDIMYSKMNLQDWNVAVDPKTRGSWNLHDVLPKGMDFFILASSISGIIGQATQINYAAGCTFQDALARYRQSIGEKAVSLDLGILATGGMVTQTEGLLERLVAEGVYKVLSEKELLGILEYFCDSGLQLDCIPAQVISGITDLSLHDRLSTSLPLAFSHPLWNQVLARTERNEDPSINMNRSSEVGHSLSQAASLAEKTEIVSDALAGQISSLVMTPRANINMDEPLYKAGADSLSAVYLRNWIMKEFAVEVTVFDILGDMPITALGKFIASESSAATK
ncbi:hypothetical protein E0Z10_g8943 [Xylaria hypoxylon]|uniref:Uncharacterized protein n=1 Tax=Xylaria hypoxylon TaxID=37992 RepID=A0A4Z0Y7P5_9PEZI|nr:hypothetical protein E0Z10_g8943 [Xylaria hypoxylon]